MQCELQCFYQHNEEMLFMNVQSLASHKMLILNMSPKCSLMTYFICFPKIFALAIHNPPIVDKVFFMFLWFCLGAHNT